MTPKSEVYNCDCLEYMKTLPDKYFDLAIADPPYGGAGNQDFEGVAGSDNDSTDTSQSRFWGQVRKIQCSRTGTWSKKYQPKWGGIIAWDIAPCEDWFNELYRVSKNQIIWGANYFPNMPATRCFIVWEKLSISERFSMAMCEYAWTSFDGNAKLYKQMPQGVKGDRFHPTQKPIELYAWILKNFAKEGESIFDPMMGSMSSRIAAYKLGFDYVGCEMCKEYFDAGNERFERHCLEITKTKNGQKYEQKRLFD